MQKKTKKKNNNNTDNNNYKTITYHVIDPRGKCEEGIGVGVERDLYTCFWGEVLDSLCIGSTERVPFVRHDLYIESGKLLGKCCIRNLYNKLKNQ